MKNDIKKIIQYLKLSIEELKQLAKQGDAGAQFNMALCYKDGFGVKKDLIKAAEWFTKAAKQGDKEARKNLNDLKNSLEYFNLRYF